MKQYGYVDNSLDPTEARPNVLPQNGIQEYIKKFQLFAGLPKTGELDHDTVKMMNTPRCGVKDVVGISTRTNNAIANYALEGSRWPVKRLTYKISKYPSFSRMSNNDVDYEIAQALQVLLLLSLTLLDI